MIDDVKYDFLSKEEFLATCENRSIFTRAELERFWREKGKKLLVVKFIFVKSLEKRLNLKYLWDKGYVDIKTGPRPFDELTDGQFNQILKDSNTDIFTLKEFYK